MVIVTTMASPAKRLDTIMLSVILPTYNECNRLEACVAKLELYLSAIYPSYEIIIAEDNSTDGSYEIARGITEKNPRVILLHNDSRLGRGTSLSAAIKKARGNYIIYMDVDLATDISYIRKLVESLEIGFSIATGSRLMMGSNANRPLSRDVASKAYNMFVRLLFRSPIYDHQCGFKGFNRKDIIGVIDLVQDNHWFWDTELLLIGEKIGLKIDEFPVDWKHNGGNNLNGSKVRVLKDAHYMGIRLLKLKYRLLTQGRNNVRTPDQHSGILTNNTLK